MEKSPEEMRKIFLDTGKSDKEVEKNMKNKELTKLWHEVIIFSEVALPCDKAIGNQLFELANKVGPHTLINIKLLARYIGSGQLLSKFRLDLGKKYLEALPKEKA